MALSYFIGALKKPSLKREPQPTKANSSEVDKLTTFLQKKDSKMIDIFQHVLFDKRKAKGNIRSESLVFPASKICLTLEYTRALEKKRLVQLHSSDLPNAQRMINDLASRIEYMETVMKLGNDLQTEFKPMQYLDSFAETLESFIKNNNKEKFYPRMLRRRLKPCFKELHFYQFYEEFYRMIPDGAELLLKSAFRLKKKLSLHFQFDCKLIRDSDEFKPELVADYFRILERFENRHLRNQTQLLNDQVTAILTSYFSSSEVMGLKIDVRDVNVDVFGYGQTVQKFSDEAVVIGRNPEEFITIFESSDTPQYVTVVTGPHYGHPFNRDVTTIKIEDENSLKVVVDDWFKSELDSM